MTKREKAKQWWENNKPIVIGATIGTVLIIGYSRMAFLEARKAGRIQGDAMADRFFKNLGDRALISKESPMSDKIILTINDPLDEQGDEA